MALSYHGTSLRHPHKAYDLSRVQPPDAENRMSGGVEGLRGEIPVSPSDRFSITLNLFNNIELNRARELQEV